MLHSNNDKKREKAIVEMVASGLRPAEIRQHALAHANDIQGDRRDQG